MDSREGYKPAFTDERLESAIATVLRAGVLTSAIVVTIGGVFYLIQNHAILVSYSAFRMEGSNLRTISGIVSSALRLRADALIQLGLVLLIATPIARVGLATLGFYYEGDRLYVAVSLTVLALLIFSIAHAL
jgi:uncharacterized membrane protein